VGKRLRGGYYKGEQGKILMISILPQVMVYVCVGKMLEEGWEWVGVRSLIEFDL